MLSKTQRKTQAQKKKNLSERKKKKRQKSSEKDIKIFLKNKSRNYMSI